MSSSEGGDYLGGLIASDRAIYYALAATGLAATSATMWWLARDSYYEKVPLRYQYRPGTFTGWIAKQLDKHAKRRRSRRPIRVYMDGCFDLMHYGHANALRQAKALGDELVVGLVPDSEIRRCKGPPLLNESERLKLVQSVKWVDEVITGVPYDLTPEFLDILFHRHKIDYVIHGDDPCLLPDGTDAYAHAKQMGRFRLIKRTEGVSTTDIVGRMLLCTRSDSFARVPEDDISKAPLTHAFSRGAGGYGSSSSSSSSSSLDSTTTPSTSSQSDEYCSEEISFASGDHPATPVYRADEKRRRSSRKKKGGRGGSDGSGAGEGLASSSQGGGGGGGGGDKTPSPLHRNSRKKGVDASHHHHHHNSNNNSHGKGYGKKEDVPVSRFMPTSRRIVQFSSGRAAPRGAKIVYIDGAFDLFNVGHVEILQLARAQGDFLLVGVHTDEEVAERRGPHQLIMGLHERALSVLACKYADEVIIGAPGVISEDLLLTFGVSLVVRGNVHESGDPASEETRYAVPREKGMFRVLKSPSNMTSVTMIKRIVDNRAQFEQRQAKKTQTEAEYYKGAKQYVDEV